jgi:mono/diheme cytochrome c family protein
MKMVVVLGALTVIASGALSAAETDPKAVARGRTLFMQHCASCHGADAKGAGPAAAALKTPVPDLTHLPRKDGKFDADRARTFIDGTQAATAHGTREMPVWGKVFEKAGDRKGPGAAQTDVWTLVEYLASLQPSEGK